MEAAFSPEQTLGKRDSTSIIGLVKEKFADWWSMLMIGEPRKKPESFSPINHSELKGGYVGPMAPVVEQARRKQLGHKDLTSQIK